MSFYGLARGALFRLEPERAHDIALASLKRAERFGLSGLIRAKVPQAPCSALGLDFANPVGLAAGLDKNGDFIDALGALGFGFLEIGTITPRPQPGNPKPRLFRLTRHQALINRLGFNNKGVDHLVRQVEKRRWQGVLGINIGKNKDTPNKRAVDDYRICLESVFPLADYVTVNISSPNTEGLRDLQAADSLRRLLGELKNSQAKLAGQHQRRVPILLKVAPDLGAKQIEEIAHEILEAEFEGLLATNTTLSRPGIEGVHQAEESGGLSGEPLAPLACHVLKAFRRHLPRAFPILGVGGITSATHARDRLTAGADLLQIYTGFIYRGPQLIADCVNTYLSHAEDLRQRQPA